VPDGSHPLHSFCRYCVTSAFSCNVPSYQEPVELRIMPARTEELAIGVHYFVWFFPLQLQYGGTFLHAKLAFVRAESLHATDYVALPSYLHTYSVKSTPSSLFLALKTSSPCKRRIVADTSTRLSLYGVSRYKFALYIHHIHI